MSPERWQNINKIFNSAVKADPSQRASVLSQLCGADEDLRRQIESLLASHDSRPGLMSSPAHQVAVDPIAENPHIQPGQTINHYRILEQLGVGGMGEVYLALDTKLGRKVALKMLPVQFTRDVDRLHRFQQEASAASALNHPNIITIYEIGEAQGREYIATEYIEGETLRALMDKSGVSEVETLDVAIQIAAALEAAHEHGIVHRDIKPDNVMVRRRDRIVKVLDFGLAKLTDRSIDKRFTDSELATRKLVRTMAGAVMGTTYYMSPEQARGIEIDERTDIWSLGIVLYEMLTGTTPFRGDTAEDVRAAILKDESSPLPPSIAASIRQLVNKALAKDKTQRYQSISELLADMRAAQKDHEELEAGTQLLRQKSNLSQITPDATVSGGTVPTKPTAASSAEFIVSEIKSHRKAITVASLLLAITVGGLFLARYLLRKQMATTDAIDSIAVLPFLNESQDSNAEYLSDGISDSIINRLSQLSNLRVASLSSVMRYKGQTIDPIAVGRDLKVRAVLVGWMQKQGNDLSFRTELVDARDNRRIWGTVYSNRQIGDLLQMQEQISRNISESLQLRLTNADQQRLVKTETKNTEAYQLYLQGRYYWNRYTEEGWRKSIDFFKQAVDKDVDYALAYSGLADTYSVMGDLSLLRPTEAYPKAEDCAKRALALNENLPQAHVSLGIVKMFYSWDWAGAEKELLRAKELNPNYPDTYHFYGHYLQMVGRTDDAIAVTKQGVELDPVSLVLNGELGFAYWAARQPTQAIAQGRKAQELDKNFFYGSYIMAIGYEMAGKYQEAIDELNRARPISSDWSYIVTELAYSNARLGNRAEALKLIQQLKTRSARGEYIDSFLIATIYAGLNDNDEVFAWLEKAYQERGAICFLKVDGHFDSVRNDARFFALQRRMNLPV